MSDVIECTEWPALDAATTVSLQPRPRFVSMAAILARAAAATMPTARPARIVNLNAIDCDHAFDAYGRCVRCGELLAGLNP